MDRVLSCTAWCKQSYWIIFRQFSWLDVAIIAVVLFAYIIKLNFHIKLVLIYICGVLVIDDVNFHTLIFLHYNSKIITSFIYGWNVDLRWWKWDMKINLLQQSISSVRECSVINAPTPKKLSVLGWIIPVITQLLTLSCKSRYFIISSILMRWTSNSHLSTHLVFNIDSD